MIKKKMVYVMLLTSVMSMILPANMLATSNDKMSDEESKVQEKADDITAEINSLIATINDKYQNMADLEENIASSKEKIEETRSSITTTEENIVKRMDSVGEQLQSMQLKSVGDTPFANLLSAENLTDFFNRVYAVSVLGSAQKDKLNALNQDQESLESLEKSLLDTQSDLDKKKTEAKSEEESLDQKLSGLKKKLADNSSTLEGLALKRVEKENSKREEALIKAAKLVKNEETETELLTAESSGTSSEASESATSGKTEQLSSDTESTNSQDSSVESSDSGKNQENSLPKPTPMPEEKPSTPSGSSMSGQATAYTATGNLTATGTTPGVHRTIAVDPSVIPLGSSVKITVPSMPAYSGVYIAEDTGGVVHGNIIDIFVGSDSEASNFGRRAIQFEIL